MHHSCTLCRKKWPNMLASAIFVRESKINPLYVCTIYHHYRSTHYWRRSAMPAHWWTTIAVVLANTSNYILGRKANWKEASFICSPISFKDNCYSSVQAHAESHDGLLKWFLHGISIWYNSSYDRGLYVGEVSRGTKGTGRQELPRILLFVSESFRWRS